MASIGQHWHEFNFYRKKRVYFNQSPVNIGRLIQVFFYKRHSMFKKNQRNNTENTEVFEVFNGITPIFFLLATHPVPTSVYINYII